MKVIKLKIKELIKVSAEKTIGREEFNAQMKRQEELINELKVLAKAKSTLLGRIIQFPCADSYALYLVVQVNVRSVVVYWLNWCDGWQDDRLGVGGSLSLKYAQESIWGRDRMEDFFSKKHVKEEAPTGTTEAVVAAMEHEMKSDKKTNFIYYNEKKL